MPGQTGELERRIQELENRLARAEQVIASLNDCVVPGEEPGTTLRAPIRVLDGQGNLVLEITALRERSPYCKIRLLNPQGHEAVALGADYYGGFLSIRDAEGHFIGGLDVESYGGRMQILNRERAEGVRQGVFLYGQEQGGGITISSEMMVIGLWTTEEGSEIWIWHLNPKRRIASLFVSSETGMLDIRHEDGDVERVRLDELHKNLDDDRKED